MPVRKLREFLDAEGVKHVTVQHSAAFTAQEVAASAHVPGGALAKTVIVNLDGKPAMVVLPASRHVDMGALKDVAAAETAELATEEEFQGLFPDCELGAMPPFGNLYEMAVYSDESLSEDEEIAFNAGTHKELVKLAYKDYERLVNPKVGRFSV